MTSMLSGDLMPTIIIYHQSHVHSDACMDAWSCISFLENVGLPYWISRSSPNNLRHSIVCELPYPHPLYLYNVNEYNVNTMCLTNDVPNYGVSSSQRTKIKQVTINLDQQISHRFRLYKIRGNKYKWRKQNKNRNPEMKREKKTKERERLRINGRSKRRKREQERERM